MCMIQFLSIITIFSLKTSNLISEFELQRSVCAPEVLIVILNKKFLCKQANHFNFYVLIFKLSI